MGELIQEIVDPFCGLKPVLYPTMHLEDILAQPAPPFSIGLSQGA